MIQRLVAAALRFPILVLVGLLALVAGGALAYKVLDIEAYPNPVPPLVEVIAQPPGWSAEETERYVTIPLEVGLSGMPGLDHIRSQSLFQLSDVKCYFKWGTDYKDARQEVINRLQFVTLSSGVTASISPWNAIGEVYRYTLRGKGYSLKDLKAAEDFVLERQFKQVPGVVDVTSYGGETKQYHVQVDPYRLKGQGVTLAQISQALQNANQNAGGDRLPIGEQSYDIRGIGLIEDVHDIEDIVVAEGAQLPNAPNGAPARAGTPVRIRDVATVDIGHAPRLGMVGRDDEADVVQGIILMRYGAETPSTLDGIYERLDYIRENNVLPPGMEIASYYDRNNLVKITTRTVIENVVVGMILVTAVLFLFLGHTRAALITALNIPLALLVAFAGLVATNTSANLISIGAVDFGIVVDSTIIMMENIFRHLGPHGKGTMKERILAGAREVAGPMGISTLIIALSFLPLFTMTGVSGVIFSPMARTYAFAIGGGILLALTLTPVLAHRFVPAKAEEKESRIMHVLHRVYDPLFDAADLPLRRALPAPGRRVHAEARGGQPLDPRDHADEHLVRAVGQARRAYAQHRARLPAKRGAVHRRQADAPGGALCRLAARSPRRRHRRHRLLQHRALRAAQALRRVAPRRHEGHAHRGAKPRAARGLPRRGVQLLAVHQRQRPGSDGRREGRELREGVRARPA
jgi:heavy metal efflux system protein